MIRTVIIDDEPLARARITRLIKQYKEFTIVGQAGNGSEGIVMIEKLIPDLVFLDIEMPDMDGFKMLNAGHWEQSPFVVFCTAYSQHAFEADAIDYLLKPYDAERFDRTLQKVRVYLESAIQKKEIETEIKGKQFITEVIIIEKGMPTTVPLHDVRYIEAYGNYIKLHKGAKQYIYRSTMNEMFETLDPDLFQQIHRSLIVNTGAITGISYKGKNVYSINVEGNILLSGRKYASNIKLLSTNSY